MSNGNALKSVVIYLIPAHGIGGVERAAESIRAPTFFKDFFFLRTISKKKDDKLRLNTIYFSEYASCIISLIRDRPKILVVSLWRACLVGLAIKILRPHTKLVVLLHFPQATHILDFLITFLSTLVSSAIWADSRKTANRLGVISRNGQIKIISFVTRKSEPVTPLQVRPVFIFWGRLHSQKNLTRALAIYKKIIELASLDSSRFYIIGPDCGDRVNIISTIKALSLADKVTLVGPKSFTEIQEYVIQASFYLQTSKMEGMAMSVVEAMQLGLVPIVTPVGEIANYAVDGINAVLVEDELEAVSKVVSLLDDQLSYQRLRIKAIETWGTSQLFTDSFFAELESLDND